MAILKSVTVLTAFLLLTAMVDSESNGRLPYVVKIEVEIFAQFTGCLLSNEWVISVAHETDLGGRPFKMIHHVLGLFDETRTRFVHPKFEYGRLRAQLSGAHPHTFKNDLALFKLTRKIVFTDGIQPVLLPKPYGLFVDEDAMMGWVDITVPFTVISFNQCVRVFHYEDDLTHETICATSKNPYAKSDYTEKRRVGGPLVLESDNRTLIGIHSFRRFDTTASMRINSYLSWIEDITGITPN